jgi:hypothetical protein
MHLRKHKSIPLVLKVTCSVMLALLATSALARDLVWKQHDAAKRNAAPRTLPAQRAEPMPAEDRVASRTAPKATAEQPAQPDNDESDSAAEVPVESSTVVPTVAKPTLEPNSAGQPAGHLVPVQVLVPATSQVL